MRRDKARASNGTTCKAASVLVLGLERTEGRFTNTFGNSCEYSSIIE